jgi:hypothetical protein
VSAIQALTAVMKSSPAAKVKNGSSSFKIDILSIFAV